MSLKVNFATHSKELNTTYKAVLNGDDGVSWALFGYDKGTNDLKVLGSGGKHLIERLIFEIARSLAESLYFNTRP
jgi:drebrin-like protein